MNVEWPPRRPDLTSLYFFLWKYLTKKVSGRKTRDTNPLEAIIREECGQVQNEMLVRAVQNVQPRLVTCEANIGAYNEF